MTISPLQIATGSTERLRYTVTADVDPTPETVEFGVGRVGAGPANATWTPGAWVGPAERHENPTQGDWWAAVARSAGIPFPTIGRFQVWARVGGEEGVVTPVGEVLVRS